MQGVLIMYKYFHWKGRISQLGYINSQLLVLLFFIGIVLTTLPLIYESRYDPAFVDSMAGIQFYTNLFSIFVVYWDLCFKIKRFHDIDYSPFNIFWFLVPGINLYFFVILFLKKGTIGPNKYGPDPLNKRSPEYKETA